MVVAFKHVNMGGLCVGEFYETFKDFADKNFTIKVSDIGKVYIDGKESKVSYSMQDPNKPDKNRYTKEEVLKDYIKSNSFIDHCRSHFYSVYRLNEQII